MDDVFLTPKQAAAMLNLSAYTIRAYARQGIIPAQKVGRGWRFSHNDLMEWLRLGQGHQTQEQDEATETLRAIRHRAEKGNVDALVRDSRTELLRRNSAVQLNIDIPHDKEHLVSRLDQVAKALGRPKNELVLEALERFLALTKPRVALPVREGKVIGRLSREEIYGGRGSP